MIELKRQTKETSVKLSMDLYGKGIANIDTSIGFFNHMLETFAKHSLIDLNIKAIGDIDVDYHHTVEDVGIVLGEALAHSVQNKKIKRYGFSVISMDEALVLCSVDLCNRIYFVLDAEMTGSIMEFDTELVKDFFKAFADNSRIVLHIKQLSGINKHHIIEAIFKSVAYSIQMAKEEVDAFLSTKGKLY